jgi:pSer/pThr/pTyr-binding forkhead associated (FHA) protein
MSTLIDQIAPPVPPVLPRFARLVVSRGPGMGTSFPLAGTNTTIGRRRDNDVALCDSTVSGRHAEIRFDGQKFVLVDVGSFNGTYVNRHPVDSIELADGDEVWIGRHRLMFLEAPAG